MATVKSYFDQSIAPNYELEIGSERKLVGEFLRGRLQSITVDLSNEFNQNQLSLVVDDDPVLIGANKKEIQLPKQGDELILSIGYGSTLYEMGNFVIDSVSRSGSSSGLTMTVAASNKPLTKTDFYKWENESVFDIVGGLLEISGSKLTLNSSSSDNELKQKNVKEYYQNNESARQTLGRILSDYDAILKPAMSKRKIKGLALCQRGSAGGCLTIESKDLLSWNFHEGDRGKFTAVEAVWYDIDNAKRYLIKKSNPVSGEDLKYNQVCRIPDFFKTKEEAELKAKAKLRELQRVPSRISFSVIGDPTLIPETVVKISTSNVDDSQKWIIQKVSHTLSGAGYQCTVDACLKQ